MAEDDNTQEWLVTYADMITLLMTFFVLFYSVKPGLQNAIHTKLVGVFQKGSGVLPGQTMPTTNMFETQRKKHDWQKMMNFVRKNGLGDQVQVFQTKKGLQINLGEKLTFRSGQAVLLDKSKSVLDEIAGIIDDNIQRIDVRGNTDDIPIHNSEFNSNWELGAARAISVVRYLVRRTNIDPGRFRATSLGEYNPIASNQTVEGRKKNRRVEIIINYPEKMDTADPGG